MQDVIFIYRKKSMFRVINLKTAAEIEKQLKSNGWEHLETLSASAWLEDLLNSPVAVRKRKIEEIIYKEL